MLQNLNIKKRLQSPLNILDRTQAKELAARAGGWTGEREFELAGKKTLAADSVRFTFK